jgi:hypothetical protein
VCYTQTSTIKASEREREKAHVAVFNSNPSSPDSIPTLTLEEVLLYYPGGKH